VPAGNFFMARSAMKAAPKVVIDPSRASIGNSSTAASLQRG